MSFFRDDISGNNSIRPFFSSLVALQGAEKNLNKDCLNSTLDPYLCFFPQYALQNIKTPYFILNSAYDVYQFHHIFVPPSSDPRGHWSRCKADPSACSTLQIATLQGTIQCFVQIFATCIKRTGVKFIELRS
uniref:Pectin acetylesterase n=1 Tax=Aegilops tauschii subsp. strangulata TaxID=200361 RepID=A0A452YTR8_AEGTS